MNMFGQRWRYEIGNSIVSVDNAFSWTFWAQERLVVNGETVQSSGGWARIRQSYKEPWLTLIGDAELSIHLASRATSVNCAARLADEKLVPVEILTAKWRGSRGTWPAEAAWTPQDPERTWASYE